MSAPLFTRPATYRSPHRFPPRAAVSVTLARPALCCSACSPAHIRNPSPSGGAPSRRVRSGCCVAVVAGSSRVIHSAAAACPITSLRSAPLPGAHYGWFCCCRRAPDRPTSRQRQRRASSSATQPAPFTVSTFPLHDPAVGRAPGRAPSSDVMSDGKVADPVNESALHAQLNCTAPCNPDPTQETRTGDRADATKRQTEGA